MDTNRLRKLGPHTKLDWCSFRCRDWALGNTQGHAQQAQRAKELELFQLTVRVDVRARHLALALDLSFLQPL